MSNLNRRQLLAGAMFAALGTVFAGSRALADPNPVNPLMGVPTPTVHPAAPRLYPAAAPTPANGSLQLTVQSTLSQDWFDTASLLLGETTDAVIPVALANQAAAVVLDSGVLSLVQPDSTVTTGWRFTSIVPDPVQSVQAVQTPELDLIFIQLTTVATPSLYVYGTVDSSGTWTQLGTQAVPSLISPVRAGITADGSAAFYAWQHTGGDNPFELLVTYIRDSATAGYTNEIAMSPDVANLHGHHHNPSTYLDSRIITDVSLVPPGGGTNPGAFGVWMDGDHNEVYLINTVNITPSDVTWTLIYDDQGNDLKVDSLWGEPLLLPGAAAPAGSKDALVTALLYTDAGGVLNAGAVDSTGVIAAEPLFNGTAGGLAQADWYSDTDGTWYVYELDNAGTLWLETLNVYQGAATPPIPISSNVQAFYQVPQGVSSGTALFVKALDQSVQLLSRNSGTGAWTSTPILSDTSQSQELSSYRTQISIADALGAPQVGVTVTVTPTADTAAWQMTGAAYLPAGVATSLVTDGSGEITLAFPAGDLSTPSLTIAVITDSAGNAVPSFVTPNSFGNPITVTSITHAPDNEMHTFLQGNGTLLLPTTGADAIAPAPGVATPLAPTTISDPVLQAATVPGATTAAPLFAGLTTSSTGTASSISHIVNSGASAQAGLAATPQVGHRLYFDADGVLQHETLAMTTGVGSASSWFNSIAHDIESIYRAIKAEITAVTSFVANKLDEAGHLIVELAVTIGTAIKDTIQIVVTDLRSAAMAVMGVMKQIGAKIEDAINWLKTNILGLFHEVKDTADLLNHAMTVDVPAAVDRGIDSLQSVVAGGLKLAETDLNEQFAKAEQALTGRTLSNPNAPPLDPPATADQTKAGQATSSPAASWLREKAKHLTPSAPSGFGSSNDPTDLLTTVTSSSNLPSMQSTAKNFQLSGVKPTDFFDKALYDILTDLQALLDDGLALVDELLAAVFGFLKDAVSATVTAFGFEIGDIPVIGTIFKLLGFGDLSLVTIASWIVAFPLVIGSKLLGAPANALAGSDGLGDDNDDKWFTMMLDLLAAVGQLLSVIPVAIIDSAESTGVGAGAVKVWQLVGAMFGTLTLVQAFPFDLGGRLSGVTAWQDRKDTTPGTRFGADEPLITWSLSWIPTTLNVYLTFASVVYPAVASMVSTVLPWINSIFGILLTAVELAGAVTQDPVNPVLVIQSCLGNLPAACSWLTWDELNAEFLGVPLLIKIALDVGVPPASADLDIAAAIVAAVS